MKTYKVKIIKRFKDRIVLILEMDANLPLKRILLKQG